MYELGRRKDVLDNVRQNDEVKVLAAKRIVECRGSYVDQPANTRNFTSKIGCRLTSPVPRSETLPVKFLQDRAAATPDLADVFDIRRRELDHTARLLSRGNR
jgi:hypothetical protein